MNDSRLNWKRWPRAIVLAALCGALTPSVWAAPVTVTALSNIRVNMAGPAASGPFDATEVAYANATFVNTSEGGGDDTFSIAADFGSGGGGAGSARVDAARYWASVYAPNNHRQPVLSHGGNVKIYLEQGFRKLADDARLWSVFSGFTARVGYDREFGGRCPPGQEDCLQAGWTWTAEVYDSDQNLTYGATRFATVSSNPNSSSGFVFTELLSDFLLDIQSGPNGITLSTPPSGNVFVCNCMVVPLELNEIAVGEHFEVRFTLEAWAFDGASDSAPGRYAHVFVSDPQDGDLGVGMRSNGLLALQPGTPAQVPAPATLWLLLPGAAWIASWRRRKGCGERSPQPHCPT